MANSSLIDLGSRKHVLDVLETDFCDSFNAILADSGFSLATTPQLQPYGRQGVDAWTELEVEEYLQESNRQIANLPSLADNWWLAHFTENSSRPTWDLIGHLQNEAGDPGVLLVEAKANLTELNLTKGMSKSTGSAESDANEAQIKKRIQETQRILNRMNNSRIKLPFDHHFQLVNRLAYSCHLAELGYNVVLVYLGFCGDTYFKDPIIDQRHWDRAMGGYIQGVVSHSFPERRHNFEGGGSLQMLIRILPVIRTSVKDEQYSFGWDLASYGEGSNSALCFAKRESGHIRAEVLRCEQICKPKLKGINKISDTVEAEKELLDWCCKESSLFVDVPIDLRPLNQVVTEDHSFAPQFYWQLYRRPIDQVFDAIAPIADRIGYAVARLANLISHLSDRSPVRIGSTLFETYPAAILQLLERNCPDLRKLNQKYRWCKSLKQKAVKNWPESLKMCFSNHYKMDLTDKNTNKGELIALVHQHLSDEKCKYGLEECRREIASIFEVEQHALTRHDSLPYKPGKAKWSDGKWIANEEVLNDRCLSELMNILNIYSPDEDQTLSDDEFDSIICAILGCLPECVITEDDLIAFAKSTLATMHDDDSQVPVTIPSGYRLLEQWPSSLKIQVTFFECEKFESLKSYLEQSVPIPK